MLIIPNFDPKTFSDDELFEKQVELMRRQYMALRFGKPDMVNQLQILIRAIEIERNERIYVDRIGKPVLNSDPVVVDTEPREDAEPSKPLRTAEPAPHPQRRRRQMRTEKPVNPNDNGAGTNGR